MRGTKGLRHDALRKAQQVKQERDARRLRRERQVEAALADFFERMAQDNASSDWERSAGAYWTARAHLRSHHPELVNQWLKAAAEWPRTFYGQLARKRLGLDLELVDQSGKVLAKARTDFDGFFLFERVPYGAYTIRIDKESAATAKVLQDLGLQVQVSGEKSIIRTGAVHARPLPVIASAETAQPTP